MFCIYNQIFEATEDAPLIWHGHPGSEGRSNGMRGRDSSSGSSAASSSHNSSTSESSNRAGQVSSMSAAGASSMRDFPAAQPPHRVRAACKRLPDWCPQFRWLQRLHRVWRPLLGTLLLGLLFASPLIWSRQHEHLGTRRAGYRFVCASLSSSPFLCSHIHCPAAIITGL